MLELLFFISPSPTFSIPMSQPFSQKAVKMEGQIEPLFYGFQWKYTRNNRKDCYAILQFAFAILQFALQLRSTQISSSKKISVCAHGSSSKKIHVLHACLRRRHACCKEQRSLQGPLFFTENNIRKKEIFAKQRFLFSLIT